MRKLAMTAFTLLLLGASPIRAEDPAPAPATEQQKQMEALGALRGRVMSKLETLRKSVDTNRNGVQEGRDAIQQIYTAVSRNIGKQMQAENQVQPPENRNQALIDDLNRKGQTLNELWTDYQQKDWPLYAKRMGEKANATEYLRQVFASVANVEIAWTTADLDMQVLMGVLAAIELRIDAVQADADSILTDHAKALEPLKAL